MRCRLTQFFLSSSTYQSTVFLTTTDSRGSTTLSAPSAFTSTLVSTNSLGQPITVTQIINNPTLIPNGSHGGASSYVPSASRPRFLLTLAMPPVSSFFQNKGAVTGVFVLVGFVVAAIAFVLIFCFRRRRKSRQRDHDTTEILKDHGNGRHVLIDSDDHLPGNDPRTVATPTGPVNGVDAGMPTPPTMSLNRINPAPVSVGFDRRPHNPAYLPNGFGPTYNPYTENQVPYRHADPGRTNHGGIPNFSVPSGSGVGPPFFGHSQNDSNGSSEPLLGVNSDADASPEPAIPSVPPRNPLRPMGGAGNSPGDIGGLVNGRSWKESTSYRDDDSVDYGALRKGSLKVHLGAG